MRLTWVAMTCGALSCSGCLFDLPDGHDHDDEDVTPLISIATGAQVDLHLEDGGLCSQSVGAQCLSARPDTILDVVVGDEDVVELGGRQLDTTLDVLVVELSARMEGRTALEVTYVDARGDEHTDRFDLRVADLERVELDVLCSNFDHSGYVFPVTAGVEVPFEHMAFDVDGNELATGRMEVVEDFGGFTVQGPPQRDGDIRYATAPAEAGVHDWPLLGESSETPRFPVYLPGAFDLVLTEASSIDYPSGVHVGRAVDGAPLCFDSGEARADIEVTAGPCLPLIGQVEILDPVPVSLTEEDIEIGLSGVGQCEVRATLAGGPTASITLDVDNPAPVPQPGTGTEIGSTTMEYGGELEQYGDCTTTKNLSNGNCEIIDAAGFILPDADCLFDVEWKKYLYDGTSSDKLPGGSLMGVGLASELRINIEYELVGLLPFGSYAPNELMVASTPPEISIENNGCDSDDAQVLGMVPQVEADFDLQLSANNAFDDSHYDLRARTVQWFGIDFGAQEVAETASGTEAWFFVGNRIEGELRYEDGSGNRLYGTAPLLVSSDDATAGATIAGTFVETGVVSTVISVSSPVAPQVHRVVVAGADAISGVQGLTSQQVTIGTSQCFEVYPVGEGNLRIHGTSPVRPQLGRVGDDAFVFEIDRFSVDPDEICLKAAAPGTVDLDLGWGAASVVVQWTAI